MEDKELLTLAGRLNLPEAVLAPLAAAAKALPEGLPIKQLTEPEAAAADWKTITAQLPVWQEDNGMAQLAVMLAAACRTEERYRREDIPAEVFLSTMDCFRRFLEETHARTGQWAFDRGFWTWRQTGGLLFRLGTLEFEYRRMRPGPQPEGIEAEAPVLSVHIPSDAVLEREKLDSSYNMALRFSPRKDDALGAGPGLWYAAVGFWLQLWVGCCLKTPAFAVLLGTIASTMWTKRIRSFMSGFSVGTSPWRSCRSIPASSGQ